jgi:hypothetical protein
VIRLSKSWTSANVRSSQATLSAPLSAPMYAGVDSEMCSGRPMACASARISRVRSSYSSRACCADRPAQHESCQYEIPNAST